ncbi:MAG: diguanylate cyclase, partial [Clostridiales bacterium]|nr:diguanylate cyclase [Clostridiales bacterium]
MGINIRRIIAGFIAALAVSVSISCTAFALDSDNSDAEKELIYVSGCPDSAPIEYYNSEENTYSGYIPQLLELFTEKSNYRLEYLSDGSSDERKQKLKNLQAEMISCCTKDDAFTDEQWSSGVTVFTVEADGETVEYRVLFSDIASDELIADFKSFVGSVTQAQSSGILLNIAAEQDSGVPVVYFIIICSASAVLLTALVIVIVLNRKRKRQMKLNKGTDSITGIGNYLYLKTYFKQFLNDKNRSLYSAVYFYVDTSLLAEEDSEALNIYLRRIALILNGNIADVDILSRVDECGFCVMKTSSSGMRADEWAEEMLRQIEAGQKEACDVKEAKVYAGVYPLHTHDRDPDEIILKANRSALYAKKTGKRLAVGTKSRIEFGGEADVLRSQLDDAFENDEFTVYLQFFVKSTGDKIFC